MKVSSAHLLRAESMFLHLELGGLAQVYLMIEGLNAAGSIKWKPALAMIERALEDEPVDPAWTRFIESSSGSLGVALAAICASKGLGFTCVVDPNVNRDSLREMQMFGADIVHVDERNVNGGYLGTRIAYIENALREDDGLRWLNQYASQSNPDSHARLTAPAILREFERVNGLVVGVGTGGTFAGCAAAFRDASPATRIVAVDTQGSVTFGDRPGPRFIPGLGTSCRPAIMDNVQPDCVVHIPEWQAVHECRLFALRHGLLVGGSTGSVLAALRRVAPSFRKDDVVVAISPDLGGRYLNTVYDDAWVSAHGLDAPLVYEAE